MTEISVEVRTQILQQKIQVWRNTGYDARLDAEVAQELGDDEMSERAKQRMKNAKRAIAMLEQKLHGLTVLESAEERIKTNADATM